MRTYMVFNGRCTIKGYNEIKKKIQLIENKKK